MMIIVFILLIFSPSAFAANQTIDSIIRNGTKIFGIDSNGVPSAVLALNPDGTLKGITYTALGVKVDPTAALQSSNVLRTTSVSVTTTSAVIVGANSSRRCLYVWNNSSNSAYLTFGITSNGSTPTTIVPTFTSFTMDSGPIYTGPISAIRNSGNGTMTTTECVP